MSSLFIPLLMSIVNNAEVNIGVHVSFCIMVFSGYMPVSGIAGSCASSIFSFFKEPLQFLEENIGSTPSDIIRATSFSIHCPE